MVPPLRENEGSEPQLLHLLLVPQHLITGIVSHFYIYEQDPAEKNRIRAKLRIRYPDPGMFHI